MLKQEGGMAKVVLEGGTAKASGPDTLSVAAEN